MSRAKACPFCGHGPIVGPADPERDGDAWAYVECRNERCPTYDLPIGHGVRVYDGESVADARGSQSYKNAAIRRWNQRR